MPKIELAKAKWARKMAKAGPKWRKGIEEAVREDLYRKGLALFSGQTPGAEMATNWAEGVLQVTAEQFQEAVKGKEEKWATKLLRAIAA